MYKRQDFDNGIDGLEKQLPNAKFDIISSNYDFTNTVLDSKINDYKIYNKSGIKIGVFIDGVEQPASNGADIYWRYVASENRIYFEIFSNFSYVILHFVSY